MRMNNLLFYTFLINTSSKVLQKKIVKLYSSHKNKNTVKKSNCFYFLFLFTI